MTTVYLIRHGEAEGNLYRRMQGWYDGDLTDLGRRQVAALAGRFRDIHLDAVYSSDLYRAMETAAALCRPKGLPLFTDPRLREVSVGPWEDEPFGSASAEQPEQFYRFVREPHLWELEGADTFSGLAERGCAALRDIIARHPGQVVAVCAHQCIIKSMLCKLFFGLDHADQVVYGTNTAVSRLTAEDGALNLDFQNDVSHLNGALLRIPSRRDMVIRPMAEDAVEEYIRYRKDAWQVVYGTMKGFDGPGFWLDARRTVGKDPAAMVVGYLGGSPAGMIQLSPSRDADKGVGYIPFLYLREPFRHQGLGIQLIGHAVSFYRKLGRDRLQLSVAPTNEKALGFYYKYGFYQAKKHKGLFGSLLLLEKDISLPKPPADIPVIPANNLS